MIEWNNADNYLFMMRFLLLLESTSIYFRWIAILTCRSAKNDWYVMRWSLQLDDTSGQYQVKEIVGVMFYWANWFLTLSAVIPQFSYFHWVRISVAECHHAGEYDSFIARSLVVSHRTNNDANENWTDKSSFANQNESFSTSNTELSNENISVMKWS